MHHWTKSGLSVSAVSGMALLAAVTGSARAEPAADPAAAPANGAVQPGKAALPEIVVTSEKRKESSQSVGIAITTISPETLVDTGSTKVNDLQYLVPGLQVTPQFGSGQPGFRIRGVGFDDYATNNSPTVGLYIDETAYPIPAMTQGEIFDVAQIDVLKGPQGTLYGRNTTGGAINITTNKPTDTPSEGVSIEYGSYDHVEAEGYVSGPITDTLKFRVAGITDQGGAWQTNRVTDQSLGDQDRYALRILLDFDPTSTLHFELSVHGDRDQSDGEGLSLITPLVTPFGTTPADTNPNATGWGTSPSFAKSIGISPDQKPFLDNEGWGTDLRTEWQLPFATLTDILSYEGLSRREYESYDASPLAYADVYFRSRAEVYADELRLSSPDGEAIQWVGGLYYSREHLNEVYRSGFIDIFGINAYTPYSQDTETKSVFGQVTDHITDQVALTGGLRWENESRSLNNFDTYGILPSGFVLPTTALGTSDQNRSTSYTKPSGKVELDYTPVDSLLLYASISRGVKSGGFTAYNTTTANGAGLNPFLPETLWAYEIGDKAEFLNHTLRVNAAAYYYDYTNQQVQSEIIDPIYNAIGKIVNAPSSEIWGTELDVTWKPIPSLTIEQGAGYTRGKFDVFNDVAGSFKNAAGLYEPIFVSRAGQDLGTPKFTYTGSVSYGWELQDAVVTAETNYSYRTEYFSHFGPLYDIPGYWLVDASLTLTPADAPWTLALIGRNIFDKRYDLTKNFFVGGDNIAAVAPPATFGVRASVKF